MLREEIRPEQIRWIKNVTRNGGKEVAYEDVLTKQKPVLNWPTSKGKTNAEKPRKGDIVLIFQRPKRGGGKTIMSHLFQILDEFPTEDPEFPNHTWARRIRVFGVNDLENPFPKPLEFNFGEAGNSGMACDIKKLSDVAKLTITETQQKIWDCFSNFMVEETIESFSENDLELLGSDDEIFQEGTRLLRHIQVERALRNSEAVKAKKREGLRIGNGRLICECCGFDFYETYGSLGKEFIECHHKEFISNGERETTLEDLALVCSNCHRMLHRSQENGSYISVEELTDFFNSKIPY